MSEKDSSGGPVRVVGKRWSEDRGEGRREG